ncbi:MAG TPA: PQQ-dependent dehydrogenase, methanol/ethanol family [Bryobacteraceae bacterium]|jgi:alcohol dehydrogenase (cytochrome c)|nr:PQQ-dependent dehydrogenase, methanol/ethanol family [Bryobacteraceae bacterium]
MKSRAMLLLCAAGLLRAQGGPAPVNREAIVSSVPFERILHANQEPQNWLAYSGGYSSNRYSELKQITPDNVKDLTLKWVFQSRSLEKHEVTPLVVDGIMYTIQSPNDVVALDALTGKTIWTHAYKPAPDARNCCGQMTRGLAILGDKLFLATLDAHMVALDAKTGKELWNVTVADSKDKYSFTHAPLVIKDKVIEGTAGGEFGIRGFIAAWDANTGKEVWRFYTVPGPGEPGNETWAGDSWKHGGGSVWMTGSYDPDTNLTFWGIGNPGPDWNGDGRLGDNLYTCSVVALDADTGKIKWHYQFSPHNEFDWDSVQVPVLANIQWKGSPRKVMLWANRSGMFYVLDRTNGEFLLGKPFVKVNWATGFDEKGRPIRAPGALPTKEGTLIYPGNQGATNWYSPSFSARTGLFYIPTWENSSTTYIKNEEPPEFHAGQTFSGVFPKGGSKDDDFYSAIRAIDPQTGEKKWDFRLDAPSTEAGILTTASDLLFSGGRDGQFYALDARTGKALWQTNLGPSVSAGAMTWALNGKQFVTIQAGAALFTFTLPQ